MIQATEADIKRFFRYVEKLPNGCWFWSGARSRGKGNRRWYGSFRIGKTSVRAHRFSCEVIGQKGPLPDGHDRDHTCVFSLCVNPDHVEYVPKQVNQERKVERRREARRTEKGRSLETL
jgi:hypothetical protein